MPKTKSTTARAADTESHPGWRYDYLKLVAGALLTSLLLPGVVALLIAVFGGQIQDAIRRPSCDDPRGLHPLHLTADEVKATSTLPEDKDHNHFDAKNLIDGDTRTAWAENVAGLGQGQRISFVVPESVDLELVCINNGWAISSSTFRRNGRTRIFTVTTDNGSRGAGLPDKGDSNLSSFQELPIAQGQTRSLSLTIVSVNAPYRLDPDDVITENDTAISEVELWAGGSDAGGR